MIVIMYLLLFLVNFVMNMKKLLVKKLLHYTNNLQMRKTEIKNIMVVFADNDFVCVFDWIGKVVLRRY